MRMTGLEPARREAIDPKSIVSANFTTSASIDYITTKTNRMKRKKEKEILVT